PDGQQIATWLLGVIGDESDIPQLLTNLEKETDPLRRCYIENALACLGHERGLSSLERNMKSSDPAVRTYSAEFAGHAYAPSTAPTLEKLLDDEVLDVRVRAAQSLLVLAKPRQTPAAVISHTLYPATAENPRYSEGDIVVLR